MSTHNLWLKAAECHPPWAKRSRCKANPCLRPLIAAHPLTSCKWKHHGKKYTTSSHRCCIPYTPPPTHTYKCLLTGQRKLGLEQRKHSKRQLPPSTSSPKERFFRKANQKPYGVHGGERNNRKAHPNQMTLSLYMYLAIWLQVSTSTKISAFASKQTAVVMKQMTVCCQDETCLRKAARHFLIVRQRHLCKEWIARGWWHSPGTATGTLPRTVTSASDP